MSNTETGVVIILTVVMFVVMAELVASILKGIK